MPRAGYQAKIQGREAKKEIMPGLKKLGAGAAVRRRLFGKKPRTKKAQRAKFAAVMREGHAGTLRHGGTGKPVPKSRPDIMKAIGASEAGLPSLRSAVRRRMKRGK